MNKTAQNLTWNCLPLEVKKEVQRQYQIATNAKEHFTECTLVYLFGIHNLTSDAEEEEMLYCEKSKVMKLYNKFQKDGTFPCLYAAGALDTLFGSKCPTDGNKECSNPSVVNCKHKHGDGTCSLSGMCCYKSPKPAEMTEERYQYLNSLTIEDYDNETSAEEQRKFCEYQRKYHPNEVLWVQTHSDDKEPKPAEPKLDRGQKCKIIGGKGTKGLIGQIVTLASFVPEENAWAAMLPDMSFIYLTESDLEPYTEPEEKDHIAQDLEMVDNIIKDGFRNERRLNIATQITASIYANDKAASRFDSIEALVRKAIDIADTLIAECEKKGGSK